MILCVCDLCALYVAPMQIWMRTEFNFRLADIATIPCKFLTWFSLSLGMLSVWILAGMVVQRAVYELRPFLTHKTNIPRQTEAIITLIFCASFSLNSHTILDLTVKNGTCQWSQQFKEDILPAFTWIDLVFKSVLPWSVIVAGDCVIVKAMRNRVKRAAERAKVQQEIATTIRRKITQAHGRPVSLSRRTFGDLLHVPRTNPELRKVAAAHEPDMDTYRVRMLSSALKDQHKGSTGYRKIRAQTSMTLIAITVVYLLLSLPYSVVIVHKKTHPGDRNDETFRFWECLTMLLFYSGHAVKPYILFLAGAVFHREVKSLITYIR
ncbi:hypothetical protein BaRGS_00012514 [Batillaria attramentaria]|uniref:G-protein coupled receptors family 1 profile domain-containing protein n=1 Tax=Batillaria attramentaria TaxID=370345 RepID=A0ABD0LA84_9CAEN